MDKTIFKVPGMTCASCESAVKNALLKVDGVHAVTISLEHAEVEIQHDRQGDPELEFRKAVKASGFHAL